MIKMYTKKISKIDFMLDVNIKVNNINEGFNKYEYKTLEVDGKNKIDDIKNSEEKFIEFMKSAFELNKENGMIVDFYTENLGEEELKKLRSFLNEKEDKLLMDFLEEINYEGTYFKILKKEILELFVKLSFREVFFSTFYMLDYKATVWGNYNNKFPIFYKDENIIKKYKKIANEMGIYIS